MLNFIYYPVSAILWFWHKAFGFVFSPTSGVAWALAVVFLVFTLRAILYKPFVGQVRSMRKMQEFQPEIQKLRKKYANDKQKMTQEMQRLQSEQGVNPVGGCLPVLIQVPVFIGLFHVLREFKPGKTENYIFNAEDVRSFVDADLFGAKLGASIVPLQGAPSLESLGTTVGQMLVVMIPLMIMAGVFTHITARHSVARQTEVQAANPQSAIMNKLMLYVFPIGVVVGAPFLPLAILFYWVSNNLWTLAQQRIVYKKIDAEEAAKKDKATATRQALAPKPGQKPVRNGSKAADEDEAGSDEVNLTKDSADAAPADAPPAKKPGAKPVKPSASGQQRGANNGSPNARNGRTTGGGSRPSAARKGRKRR
ncbi:membrane protein insertase, YidC/Oxa1 family [Pseudonocardia dioxanivorans CB1190]|uniref:Membrane protein insertase YidC n=1 Tax=Pseudonocardia dioxanivorans (strain ATCC 55486 / DSM 44775 / JCM 13855 / CB1190) TaxID=675635 RepID=F4CXX1_PSEUX|nr:membrane protein insertase YidC [Pseudonocardia dioxanivorans]AEA28777.1 membrane protein insertase, YidC/Oxa1 family [Pseudonocardia dioxanivorans CB1190]GJF01635.1 membrane protein insertase YidC [Pseudonocardia sp. D17]